MNKLVVTTINAGDCNIRAFNAGTKDLLGYDEQFTVTVLPLPEQSLPASPVVPTSLKGVATGTLPAKTQQNATITWTSSTTSKCTVSGTTVKAVDAGTCTLAAIAPKIVGQFTAFSDSVDIDIIEGDPQTLSAVPSLPTSILGTGSAPLPVTTQQGAQVTWSSQTSSVCTIVLSKGAPSVAGVTDGTCTIRATAPATSTFRAYQEDIDVTIQPRDTQVLTVALVSITGTGSGMLPTITTTGAQKVTWSLSTPNTCTLAGNKVTGKMPGTCTVVANAPGTAAYLPLTDSYDITINAKTAQSVNFTGVSATITGTQTVNLPLLTNPGNKAIKWATRSPSCTLKGNIVTGKAPLAISTCTVVG